MRKIFLFVLLSILATLLIYLSYSLFEYRKDFIPEESATRLHREEGDRSLRLATGRDILASLKPLRRGQTVVAFAAETGDLQAGGRRKMEAKGADLIVINDVGRADIGFESEENEVLLLTRDGASQAVSRRSKREIADKIWDAFLAVRGAAVRTS